VFDPVVLGVDPGVAAVGLAAVAGGRAQTTVRWSDTIRTPAGLADAERLRRVADAVRRAIAEHAATSLALERVMWGQNRTSALSVARATGVIVLAAAEAGLVVEEYAPLEVKMAVTGVGNADKDQVRRALAGVLRVDGVPAQADAADAVAVAVCHLHQAGLRRAARRAGGTVRA
jgi:crossover junction endodeoxyribonuclease RuvC